ncbi:hypothetical protein P3T76_006063 [Phytophthora citrophthora]|uniref:Uncharacterized protein n=1 Tax=Phytophthora citrophthora TaxID=4793 RepID=A0AAD9LPY2_9STRA|nr:hypothetical protein P3T76_006063 [Phytophthora citrophthora]
MTLELNLKIHYLRSVDAINDVFELKSIDVKRIDILESKLTDQQEELKQLRMEVYPRLPLC